MTPTPSPYVALDSHFRLRRPRYAIPYVPPQHSAHTAQTPVTPLLDLSATEERPPEPGIQELSDEESAGEDVGSEFEEGAEDAEEAEEGGIEEG